jgi:hypothetical protein
MATTETGTALRAKIEAADTAALGEMYGELVGYDPFKDDGAAEEGHTGSVSHVRAMLLGFCGEAGLL